MRSKIKLTKVSAKIGTAEDFLDYVYADKKFNSFPIKTDDKMPYISPTQEPWSGFYTSKPYLKLKARNLTQEARTSGLIYGF